MAFDPSKLLESAIDARERAYAPYSRFAVGAALITAEGDVFTGANIENASYGLSMCAERVALYNAVTHGAQRFEAIAVTGPDGVVAMPCGACRQVLHEFGPLSVVFPDTGGVRVLPLAELLPHAFRGDVLAEAAASTTTSGRNAR